MSSMGCSGSVFFLVWTVVVLACVLCVLLLGTARTACMFLLAWTEFRLVLWCAHSSRAVIPYSSPEPYLCKLKRGFFRDFSLMSFF